ncbi:MAG: NAD-dependent epimerase/dehydratase family protein [Nitrospinae bacterium]|nr:NAD-dependent epimerase/dehydratase family protein [Nitrospinota bacterium]
MDLAIVTGSAGLIGSETVRFLTGKGMKAIGIDNDMRRKFFGDEASTDWNREKLQQECDNYVHHSADIRSEKDMARIFGEYGKDVKLLVHAAAQPSHDWAAKDPATDFTVNANGTLNLLEMTRKHCPDAVFIYLSTNKVYGDRPNFLPFVEKETRWEPEESHPYSPHGIDERMSLDDTTHSLFGVSKTAADLLVQEYGRYFGMKTACFRGGCLTGSGHSGAELHGFLSYIMICVMKNTPYTVFGYKGKQVRDNIHSFDLVNALYHFYRKPGAAKVYNLGGSRFSNCSILEAISTCEKICGRKMTWKYVDAPRKGDHIWWISDVRRFKNDYPEWDYQYSLDKIFQEIHEGLRRRI